MNEQQGRYCFISYAGRDKELATELCARLEAASICVWIAPRNLAAGLDWKEAIL